jgi:hypothetical protein
MRSRSRLALRNTASRSQKRTTGLAIGGRLATAAAAAARLKVNSSRWVELALKILDGFDYKQMKRFGDEIVSGEASAGKTFTQYNQEIETKQREWLKQKGLE